MKVFPSADRVLVKKLEASMITKGGIFLTENKGNNQKMNYGEVVSVGEGRTNDNGIVRPVPFKEGDLVIYDCYAGVPVSIRQKEHVILLADDVIATASLEDGDDLAVM